MSQTRIHKRFSAAYNAIQQHPPRISLDLRTMGGYFFLGTEK